MSLANSVTNSQLKPLHFRSANSAAANVLFPAPGPPKRETTMEFLLIIKDFLSSLIGSEITHWGFLILAAAFALKLIWPYIGKILFCAQTTHGKVKSLLQITEEFKNNHGSSLRDRIDSIHDNLSHMHDDVKIIDGRTVTLMNIIGDNGLSIGIYETDSEGNCIYVNNKWSDITGINMTDAKSYGWINCIEYTERESVESNWEYAIAHHSKFDMIYSIVNINTHKVTKVRGYSFPIIGKNGSAVRFVGAIIPLDTPRCEGCIHTRLP